MSFEQFLSTPGSVIIPALLLDLLVGDPVYPLHPIRLCGNLLSLLERLLRKFKLDGYAGGIILFILLSGICLGVVAGVGFAIRDFHPAIGYAWKLYVAWSLLALGDLCRHGKHVADAVEADNLESARIHTGKLVGRDLERLQKDDCCRATIESLSENLTDGVISPLFYYLLFGIPGLVLFKVVSTMDSMVGYKTERYRRFGWCGARMDDLMNFVPARLTWLLMTVIATILPGYNGLGCFRTALAKHALFPGPNSGWSEAAAAGALELQLIGPVWRDGTQVTDLWVGPADGRREATHQDLRKMILLVRVTTLMPMILLVLLLHKIPLVGS